MVDFPVKLVTPLPIRRRNLAGSVVGYICRPDGKLIYI
jgi:hypothetical protein